MLSEARADPEARPEVGREAVFQKSPRQRRLRWFHQQYRRHCLEMRQHQKFKIFKVQQNYCHQNHQFQLNQPQTIHYQNHQLSPVQFLLNENRVLVALQ